MAGASANAVEVVALSSGPLLVVVTGVAAGTSGEIEVSVEAVVVVPASRLETKLDASAGEIVVVWIMTVTVTVVTAAP